MRGFALHQLQSLFGARMVARNGDRGYERALPDVLIIDLGDRHVELAAQAVLEALDGVPLVFERVRVFGRRNSRVRTPIAAYTADPAAAMPVRPRLRGDTLGGEGLDDVARLHVGEIPEL